MARTHLSAGRMAREPVVPKPSPVNKSPPSTTNVVETTPIFPSQPPSSLLSKPDNSPPSVTNVVEPTPTFPSQSPSSRPSNPDTKHNANKPRPKPQSVFHRPSTRSLNKVGTPENPLTVDGPSSSDEPGSEEVASAENNSDSSELDSPEPEHSPPTQVKQSKPPVVRAPVADQRKSSRRRAAPLDLVFPPPKRTKAQLALRAHSLPLAAHNRPPFEKAAEGNKITNQHIIVLLSEPQHKKAERNKKTKQNIVPLSIPQHEKATGNNEKTKQHIVHPSIPKHEKATGNDEKTKQHIIVPPSIPQHEKATGNNEKTKRHIIVPSSIPQHEKATGNNEKTKQRIIDEIIKDVAPSHSSDDITSLHVKVDLLTKMVLENNTMLKDQQVQLNHLEAMVLPILDRDV